MKKLFLICVFFFSIQCFSQNKLTILFDFNQDVPNVASQIVINKWILENKNSEILKIFGYCDSVDDSKYNKDLAKRRVDNTVAFLIQNNIKISGKVELKSFGKDFKYSKNQSENRKVAVFYSVENNIKSETDNATKMVTPFSKQSEKNVESGKNIEEDILEPIDYEALIADEKLTLKSKFNKAKKGDLIRIKNINFYFNQEKVMEQSMPLLDELLDIMLNNPKLVIEIHGHICCNPNPNDTKLSFRRALVIFKYLQKFQIPLYRMAYKGYGSNDPIYRLPEKNEKERAANRRVEILIVDK